MKPNKVDDTLKFQEDTNENGSMPRIAEMTLDSDEDELVFFGTCHCNSRD